MQISHLRALVAIVLFHPLCIQALPVPNIRRELDTVRLYARAGGSGSSGKPTPPSYDEHGTDPRLTLTPSSAPYRYSEIMSQNQYSSLSTPSVPAAPYPPPAPAGAAPYPATHVQAQQPPAAYRGQTQQYPPPSASGAAYAYGGQGQPQRPLPAPPNSQAATSRAVFSSSNRDVGLPSIPESNHGASTSRGASNSGSSRRTATTVPERQMTRDRGEIMSPNQRSDSAYPAYGGQGQQHPPAAQFRPPLPTPPATRGIKADTPLVPVPTAEGHSWIGVPRPSSPVSFSHSTTAVHGSIFSGLSGLSSNSRNNRQTATYPEAGPSTSRLNVPSSYPQGASYNWGGGGPGVEETPQPKGKGKGKGKEAPFKKLVQVVKQTMAPPEDEEEIRRRVQTGEWKEDVAPHQKIKKAQLDSRLAAIGWTDEISEQRKEEKRRKVKEEKERKAQEERERKERERRDKKSGKK